jgi:FtsP/CotA-like multicopper oxidase with cupredoxin domain
MAAPTLSFMIFDQTPGQERGQMHAINGFIFGNLPSPVMTAGERVRWYVLGMGNEKDIHTAHWHGKTLRWAGRHTDVVEVFPGSMATADMVADNPGTWLLHCHVADHLRAGMMATYTIR